ncbi:MAG TPA: hypothetical protein VH877_03840 [Polyangia bacterium]|nr:hypothetical protein [Polyangia bacterium]
MPDEASSDAEVQRFALLSTWRWVVPVAIGAGILAALFWQGVVPRWLCGGGAVMLAILWLLERRPVLVVDAEGYQVEERGRSRLRVPFAEVQRARAVPAEHAMYVDCGDPGRNLLLPPRRGFGFHFERQAQLYVLLARRLEDKLQVVASLVPAPPPAGPQGA